VRVGEVVGETVVDGDGDKEEDGDGDGDREGDPADETIDGEANGKCGVLINASKVGSSVSPTPITHWATPDPDLPSG